MTVTVSHSSQANPSLPLHSNVVSLLDEDGRTRRRRGVAPPTRDQILLESCRKAKKSALVAVIRQQTASSAAFIADGLADGTFTRGEVEEARAMFEAEGRSMINVTPNFDSKVMILRTIERNCASIAERARPRRSTEVPLQAS